MKKLALMLLVISFGAKAFEYKLAGGLLLNNHEVDTNDGYKEEMDYSFQLGAIAYHELQTNLKFRSGLLYTRKDFKGELSGIDYELTFSYLTIPATIQYQIDNAPLSLIGGLNAQIKLSDDCEVDTGTCSVQDPESLVTPLVFGAAMDFNQKFSGEFTYEYPLGDTAKKTETSSFVFNILYKL